MIGSEKYIVDYLSGRNNNFDIIRFLSALLVVFTHSYALTLGHERTEPLKLLTNQQSTLGKLAVLIFFISSGFLITQSYDRSKDIVKFIKARILRIFPALIVIALLSVFFLGPILTTYPLRSYFTNHDTYNYLRVILLWDIPYNLPGVFEGNPWGPVVNGSLWTLFYEFACYIIVAVLGIVGWLSKKHLLLCLFVITNVLSFLFVGNFLDLFNGFAAGALLYIFRNKIKISGNYAICSVILISLGTFTNYFLEIFTLFGSYLVIYLAFTPIINFSRFGKYGDFSYGIYIYGFPIQQLIVSFQIGAVEPMANFIISLPFILLMAVLSWHFVEKKALMFKKQKSMREKEKVELEISS
ncbi:acyltransferase family protein [Peribacillus asahii]|uniref:acyltransferase family protein n=1 Tax=Peribacillus asahii TaxID=228899 RepID=UPI002079AC30|nr:acyltransferase [Peribacillus asahii]USK68315.1 acyltransferase [Peribacillus asahii]